MKNSGLWYSGKELLDMWDLEIPADMKIRKSTVYRVTFRWNVYGGREIASITTKPEGRTV